MNTIAIRPENEIKARDDMNNLCKTEALDIRQICPSPTNPRKTFPEAEQADLAKSIETHGVLQPILVRIWNANTPWPSSREVMPTFEIIAGERRYRAATQAGLQFIPAMIRDFTDREVMEVQVIENLQREGLHPQEEADGYEQMMQVCGYTADELAEKIGKSRSYIYGRLKLTALCPEARQAFRDGILNPSTALLVARIPGGKLQLDALTKITHNGESISVRRAQEVIQNSFMLKLAEAPFPRKDETLVPEAGRCYTCAKRTGYSPELFPDVKSADVCTDPVCFNNKTKAWTARQIADLKTQGKKVIEGEAAQKITKGYHHSIYIENHAKLDSKCYDVEIEGKYPTYRELIEGTSIETIFVENPHSGTLVEFVPEKALAAALKQTGLKPAQNPEYDQQKENQKKAKAETGYRRRLHSKIREAQSKTLETSKIDTEGLRIAVAQLFRWAGHDYQKCIAETWHRPDEKINAHDRIREFEEQLQALTEHQLYLLMMDIALIGQTYCSIWNFDHKPEKLINRALFLGIDPEAVREANSGKKQGKDSAKTDADTPKHDAQAEAPAPVAAVTVGSKVKIKEGLKGPAGMARKCSGKEGVIDEILSENEVKVRFGPAAHAVVIISTADLEILPSTPITAAQAHEENPLTEKKAAPAKVKAPAKPVKPKAKPKAKAKQSPAKAGEGRKKTTPEQSPAKAGDMNGHTPIAAKYRHPDDHSLMWMGRGKKPRWVDLWIEGGGSLTDLEYQPKCDKTLDMFQEAV